MQYRTLGRTGIKVSPYGLGALMLGASIGNPDHDDSIRMIHKALDAGINLIDTADAYSRARPRRLSARPSRDVVTASSSRPSSVFRWVTIPTSGAARGA
jgi:aryl-alcohol dehydrogenase-like predicted oxidoreductase